MPEVAATIILYINIVTLWCYSWESRMYSNNYQAFNSARNGYNCIHTYARMLTFCVTEIMYYIIINSSYAFIKSTNMIYHNCVCQVLPAVYKIYQITNGTFWSRSLWSVYNKINIVSNIYRNINKFFPNTIIYFTR